MINFLANVPVFDLFFVCSPLLINSSCDTLLLNSFFSINKKNKKKVFHLQFTK